MNCPFCQSPNDDAAESCAQCGKPMPRLANGTVLAGRYEILAPLGQGGMGMVYKAHDRELDEVVALKVLRPDIAASSEMGKRFRSEIKLARRVRHRNVCGIHEFGQDGPLRFIAMEFLEGVDFRQILRAKRLTAIEAYPVAIEVAEGLQAVHDAGIVHRDLKTPNIMRDAKGVVRLMDFGIAKQFEGEDVSKVTGTGMIVGTPEYMSPEQVRGLKVDFRSDVYALGIVVFELFTGEVPFRGDTPIATVLKHLQDAPPLAGGLADRLPRALVPVLARALAKKPDDRFGSAKEMAEALAEARRQPSPLDATGSVSPTASAGTTQFQTPSPQPLPDAGATDDFRAPRPAEPAPRVPRGHTIPARTRPLPARGTPLVRIAIPLVVLALLGGIAVTWLRREPLPTPPPTTLGVAIPATVPPSTLAPPPSTLAPPPPSTAATSAPPTTRPAAPSPVPTRQPPPTAATAPPSPPEVARQQQAAAQTAALITQAETALSERRFDAAISLYDEALKLDPSSSRAGVGRANALGAKAMSEGPAPAKSTTRAFAQGQTTAQSEETRDAGAAPKGFAKAEEVGVKSLSQPAALPGQIQFEVDPASVSGGEEYKVRIFLLNEGAAPITIKDLVVITTVNGKKGSGGVPSRAKDVAPKQRALLFELSDFWRVEIKTWTMEAVVHTARGETYRNQIAWR